MRIRVVVVVIVVVVVVVVVVVAAAAVVIRSINMELKHHHSVVYLGILLGEGGSTNPVEDRGQGKQGSGGGSPLVRGSAQLANEGNPYSY
jgi:hypothetical protein